jgi:hypothetical protein
MCLQRRIIAIFAGIIAQLDSNDNLNFLKGKDADWFLDFWLRIFNDPRLSKVHYVDFVTVLNRDKEQESFESKNCLPCTEHVPCAVPFSWLVLHATQAAMTHAQDMGRHLF